MARGLKRSLLKNAGKQDTGTDLTAKAEVMEAEAAMPPAFRRATGGAGSAWKAGALSQVQDGLDEARENLARDVLTGDQVIEIDPEMISDPIGSDRRDDWMAQEDFLTFVASIKDNGQDMPVLVWPADPEWKPDPLDPKKLERVQFLLLAGRRRCEAARKLGRPVRAVIASQEGREGAEATFNMLVLRFRENEERQNLSAFERLVSIGQMYDELKGSSDAKISAKDFAGRIGVHESMVSRARAVHRAKAEILNAFKNVYEMSFHDLQTAMSALSEKAVKKPKAAAKPRKLRVLRKVGNRNLSVESVGGTLSIRTTGVKLDKRRLESLGDLIAEYLNGNGSD